MTSEHHDWQLAIRDRLRRQVMPLVIAGALLTYFGWVGGWVVAGSGMQRVASLLYVAAFQIGGPVLLVLAAVSWSGWRVWLLVDALAGLGIAVAFGFYGLVSLTTGAFGINAMLSLVFAVMFGTSALNSLSFFREATGVPLFGGTKPVASAGPPPPQRDATPYEGKSLAGELLKRSRGMPNDNARPQNARPVESTPPLAKPIADKQPFAPAPPPAAPPLPPSQPPNVAPARPTSEPAPPPPVDAPEGFLAALAREDEEDDDSSR